MSKVQYRLDVDYLSREYEDRMCETSSPIYTLEDGIAKYQTAITKKCIDDHAIAARVHLWKYHYTNGEEGVQRLILLFVLMLPIMIIWETDKKS